MKRSIIILALSALLAAVCSCGPKTTECINPLNYTDTPDPDVVRVGDDYYLVTTTMYYCPMVPIMHSKDLVHWEIISYVCDDLGDDDFYTFKNGRNAYGKGQWATSLQYHDGYWYVLFITNETHRTYIYRTDDVYKSGWERVSVIDDFFHDASLLFDTDGRNYVVFGNTKLYVKELESDLSGVKEGGIDTLIIDFDRSNSILGAEGTRFYHIGEYYYLLEIDWPKGGLRTERCWRSKEITGPYESHIVCDGPIGGLNSGVAQGPIVQTRKGDWYGLFFQDHGAVGRIMTVQPITWVDGWPIAGEDTKPLESVMVNLPPQGENYLWADDDFDGAELPLVWQWNHKPLAGCWSLTERPGWLRLTTGQLATGISDARNTLTQRTFGPKCESIVKMDASAVKDGDFAGICTLQSSRCAFGIARENGEMMLRAISEFRGERKVVTEQPWEGGEIWLRLRYDFTRDFAYMSWSVDGEDWNDIDFSQKIMFTLDYFTGYRTGLFNYATSELGGYADFDFFRQNSYE